MTLAELLAELPTLGPWELRGPIEIIRNAAGNCPLQAVAKRRGFRVTYAQGTPVASLLLAHLLRMDAETARVVEEASDNLCRALRTGERCDNETDAEMVRVETVRKQLVKACQPWSQQRQQQPTEQPRDLGETPRSLSGLTSC